jgi:hypothetical protein
VACREDPGRVGLHKRFTVGAVLDITAFAGLQMSSIAAAKRMLSAGDDVTLSNIENRGNPSAH